MLNEFVGWMLQNIEHFEIHLSARPSDIDSKWVVIETLPFELNTLELNHVIQHKKRLCQEN